MMNYKCSGIEHDELYMLNIMNYKCSGIEYDEL